MLSLIAVTIIAVVGTIGKDFCGHPHKSTGGCCVGAKTTPPPHPCGFVGMHQDDPAVSEKDLFFNGFVFHTNPLKKKRISL